MPRGKIIAISGFALLAACSTPLTRIDVEPAKLTTIRSIAVIRPPAAEAYAVIDFSHPGMLFGAVGGLIAASATDTKIRQLNDTYRAQHTAIRSELAGFIARRLSEQGYETTLEDAAWEFKDGKYDLPSQNIHSQADAVLIVAPGLIGFVAPRVGADFQPAVRITATLVAKDHKTELYRGHHAAGWVPAVSSASWKQVPSTESFSNFDDILAKPQISAAALRNAASAVALSVAADLQASNHRAPASRTTSVANVTPLAHAAESAPRYASAAPPVASIPEKSAMEGSVALMEGERAVSAQPGSLPPPGSQWSYTVREEGLFSSDNKQYDFSVSLASARGSSVTELFASASGRQLGEHDARSMSFAVHPMKGAAVTEFSPYLLAYAPSPALPLPQPTYPQDSGNKWTVRVVDVAPEAVSLPAGRFNAIRLRVLGEKPSETGFGGPTWKAANRYAAQRFEYTVWYAPEAGRYVQSRHQLFNFDGQKFDEQWVQLKSFRIGASAAH